MLIVTTKKRDVYRNLAVEEWLLDNAPRLPVLFLCVNDPCVVIGKNQNPWRECRLSRMEKEGVSLARRVSGGGAVCHDGGNLNLSVIVPRTRYVEEKQYELIFQALEPFGIRASRVRKNALVVEGLKFSGHAFCHRRNRTLHHGTLLVRADLDRLRRCLGPELEGIETRAVASVPAPVANLSQFAPDLTVESLSVALMESFRRMYSSGCGMRDAGRGTRDAGRVEYWNDADVEKRAAAQLLPIMGRISSDDWKFGRTPPFEITLNGEHIRVEKGRVVNRPGQPRFEERNVSQTKEKG